MLLLIQKPGVQTISSSGYHYKTTNDGTKKSIRKIKYSDTHPLRRKSPFTIIAENADEYKAWMPGHSDYSGTGKPLSSNAKFEEGKQKDSIKFEILNESHLPGICTNYPILGENPPKEAAISISHRRTNKPIPISKY